MFSWYRVSVSIVPPAKVIIVCISSSKEADGRPTATPPEENGYGPLNWLSNRVMSGCLSMIARFAAFRAALSELA